MYAQITVRSCVSARSALAVCHFFCAAPHLQNLNMQKHVFNVHFVKLDFGVFQRTLI